MQREEALLPHGREQECWTFYRIRSQGISECILGPKSMKMHKIKLKIYTFYFSFPRLLLLIHLSHVFFEERFCIKSFWSPTTCLGSEEDPSQPPESPWGGGGGRGEWKEGMGGNESSREQEQAGSGRFPVPLFNTEAYRLVGNPVPRNENSRNTLPIKWRLRLL